MIICKAIIPIVYSLFIGGAYAVAAKRRFGHSLMPAYCVQMILLLLSGMIFKNLIYGIIGGVFFSIIGYVCGIWRERSKSLVVEMREFILDRSVIAFILLALVVFVMNYGKHFFKWDEFSHWGRFLKECYRSNQLYVMSPASMAHKDYVPCITLFEYLWCKLSLAYSEANAYRGIQMLLVAVAIGVAEEIKTKGKRLYQNLIYALSIVVLMGLPLLFSTFIFYHSIYQDAMFGMLIFYSLWVALHDGESVQYRSLSLTLAMVILIMCKMTAVPFCFLIWCFYLWNEQSVGRSFREKYLWQLLPVVAPLGVWISYNWFVSLYINTSGTQSYSGFSLLGILKVILHDGSVTYQSDVELSFWKAVLTKSIVGGASFAFVAVAILVMCMIVRKLDYDGKVPYQSRETGKQLFTWSIGATVAYVSMMCFLYDTAFSEYEARKLASFDRYMCSWLIAILYLAVSVMLVRYAYASKIQQSALVIALSFIAVSDNRELLLSGFSGTDQEDKQCFGRSEFINSVVNENESILILDRGSDGNSSTKVGYYCLPRVIDFISPGPAAYDGDIWSTEMTSDGLLDLIAAHDYVYVFHVDEAFVTQYGSVVPEIVEDMENVLFKVNQDGSISLVNE